MHTLRKVFSLPLLSGAQLAECILTTLGIIGLVVGVLILPSLGLGEAGFYTGLLALVGFMLLSFCAGQLVVIRERLSSRDADA